MRKDDTHYCIECGATLPWRYKGRQRVYCSANCRKAYWEKDKKKVIKLVMWRKGIKIYDEKKEVKKKPFKPSAPYIGKNPWARQTKVEFNVSTMEESIKRMKGDK